MDWLNYHHLLYFWTVAREGSISKAAPRLRLAPPTISAQIHQLEERFGEKLFRRAGRGLELTEMGHVVFRYAEEIFSLGRELVDTVQGRPTGQPARLAVGVADVVPKLVVRALLEPALHLPDPPRIVVREGSADRLLADLTTHALDLVFTDGPVPPGANVRAFSHLLGETGLTLFAEPKLAARLRRGFPHSLEGAPMVLPTPGSHARLAIDHWLEANHLRPKIVAEVEDSALLKVFGEDGLGAFVAPSVIAPKVRRQHEVVAVGELEGASERYFAVTIERKLAHPAVVAICETARRKVFR